MKIDPAEKRAKIQFDNRRAVDEWIGKTPDSPVPDHVRQRIFLRCGGRCHIAGRKIRAGEPWDLDHVVALRDGGQHRESNLAPALKDKHREKTAREAAERAEADQRFASHYGTRKQKTSGFRGWRKFDGTPVFKERDR